VTKGGGGHFLRSIIYERLVNRKDNAPARKIIIIQIYVRNGRKKLSGPVSSALDEGC